MSKVLLNLSCLFIFFMAGPATAFDALFDTRTDFYAGLDPYSIVMVDLDGDNDLDIVTPAGFNLIALLENDGESGYSMIDSLVLADRPACVAAGDLDGDGDFDLAVGGRYDSVYIVENLGGWSFQVKSVHAHDAGIFTADIEAVDIDNDSDLDIIFSYRDYVNVMRNNGDATFGSIRPYYSYRSDKLTLADFDGDGDVDIAVANTAEDNFAIMKNDNDTTFLNPVGYAYMNPYNIETAKLDADDDYDLIVLGYGVTSVYFNNGDATFTLDSNYAMTSTYPINVAAGDLDGDGDIDFATVDDLTNVFINQGDGTFDGPTDYVTGYEAVGIAMGDIDGDADSDLAIGMARGALGVMPNNGDGTFPVEPRLTAGDGAAGICTGYFNDDGNLDLATANYIANNISVFLGNGDKTFQPQVNYPVGYYSTAIVAVDLNHDNRDDLVALDTGLSVFMNNGDGTYAPSVGYVCDYADYNEYPQRLQTGDINADGDMDIVVATYNYSVTTFLGNGDGTLQPPSTPLLGYEPATVDLADMDNDGDIDLVIGDGGEYYVYVALNNGNGTFGTPYELTIDYYPITVTADDFDGDGYNDIAVGVFDDYLYLGIFFNNGDSTYQSVVIYETIYEDPYSILSHDFDQDGDADLAVTSVDASCVAFFENDGAGNFTHTVDYGTDDYPFDACMGDFDNDGDVDIAVANYDGYTVSLLWNRFDIISDVDDYDGDHRLPQEYSLQQNFPNPFNPATTIRYNLKQRSHVNLAIYNILGQQIRTLVDKSQMAGQHTAYWDGKNNKGATVASGMYFYQIQAGNFVEAKKMILLK